MLFPLAVLAGLAAPVLVLARITPSPQAHPAIAAVGLAVAGLGVVLLAQTATGASWRIEVDENERTELVTNGLLARVRNPIFTGTAAVCAGMAMMGPTLVAVCALACLASGDASPQPRPGSCDRLAASPARKITRPASKAWQLFSSAPAR